MTTSRLLFMCSESRLRMTKRPLDRRGHFHPSTNNCFFRHTHTHTHTPKLTNLPNFHLQRTESSLKVQNIMFEESDEGSSLIHIRNRNIHHTLNSDTSDSERKGKASWRVRLTIWSVTAGEHRCCCQGIKDDSENCRCSLLTYLFLFVLSWVITDALPFL